jgi:hypothetical protein
MGQVCNHPQLCYQRSEHFWSDNVVRTCGKMFWLDRCEQQERQASTNRFFCARSKMMEYGGVQCVMVA